jgi:ribose-phosphate pyrophosphokinase
MIKVFDDGIEKTYARSTFPGGEMYIKLWSIEPGSTKPILIRWHFDRTEELFEIALLVNAIQYSKRDNIHLVCPYLPYARQDRVCNPGESFSLEVIGSIINNMNFKSVIVWDVHSDVARIQIDRMVNIELAAAVGQYRHLLTKWDHAVFIAPDKGAADRAHSIAAKFGRIAIHATKTRDPETGNVISQFDGNILAPDTDVVMVDDICDGGRTFIELAKKIRPHTTGKIYLLVSHGIFSAGFDKLREHIDRIWVVNPICVVPADYVTVI